MQLNDVLSQLSNLRKVATYFLTIAFILAVQEISAGDGWWFLPNKCSYPWPSQGNFKHKKVSVAKQDLSMLVQVDKFH